MTERFEYISFIGWKSYKISIQSHKEISNSWRHMNYFISISQHSEIPNIKYNFTVCLDSVTRSKLLQWRWAEAGFSDRYFQPSVPVVITFLLHTLLQIWILSCSSWQSSYLIEYAILNMTVICWPIADPFIQSQS